MVNVFFSQILSDLNNSQLSCSCATGHFIPFSSESHLSNVHTIVTDAILNKMFLLYSRFLKKKKFVANPLSLNRHGSGETNFGNCLLLLHLHNRPCKLLYQSSNESFGIIVMSTVNNELGHHREDLRTRVECEERPHMMTRRERVNGRLQSAALLEVKWMVFYKVASWNYSRYVSSTGIAT